MPTSLTQVYLDYAIARDVSNGNDPDYARLEGLLSNYAVAINSIVTRLSGVTNTDGTLKNFPVTGALSLSSKNRIVATAGQTSFVVASYNTSTDEVIAFSGSAMIDTNSITKTNSTHVTLPAQANGTVVTVFVYTTGVALLSKLADTSAGQGMALLGVQDDDGLFVGSNGETCLAEAMQRTIDLETALGDLSTILRSNGSVAMTADFNAAGHKITNLAAGIAAHDAVRMDQIDPDSLLSLIVPVLSDSFLPLDGGTMAGPVDMDGSKVTGLPTATAASDAISLSQAQTLLAATLPTGGIIPFGGSTAPAGWVLCDGSTYDGSNATYTPLYLVIAATYGSGGGALFKVPDFRGRMILGAGTGSGLTARARADTGGAETHTLITDELPPHHHPFTLNTTTAGNNSRALADGSDNGDTQYTQDAGSGLPHTIMNPYGVANYIIKL